MLAICTFMYKGTGGCVPFLQSSQFDTACGATPCRIVTMQAASRAGRQEGRQASSWVALQPGACNPTFAR